jgi:hypothetical protein
MSSKEKDTDQDLFDLIFNSSRSSKRDARATVRIQLREQRAKIRELRSRQKNGENLIGDIEALSGQVDLLHKELKAIDEGGHIPFLAGKNINSPKLNYSEKKENLRKDIKTVTSEISHLESQLSIGNSNDFEVDGIINELASLRKDQIELEEEMNALLQFNHTRFIEAREENRERVLKAQEESRLESEIEKQRVELGKASETNDFSKSNNILAKISQLEIEIKKLNMPEKDVFLEKYENDST